ncbi:MAG: short-chain dehydrogenase, partial [Sulfurovum sp.]
KESYLSKLNGGGKKVPFNEEPESVAKVVHRIILSERPKSRYYITKATYLLGTLKRILSTTQLDSILMRIG